MDKYPKFRPVLGLEEKILNTSPLEGYLYFATDTKKIFYGDTQNKSFIPMGGNFGLYYGKLVHSETPDEGQVEFDFSFDDLEEIDKVSTKIAPGDLILNIPDGSFYRVVSLDDDLITTNRITISGSGDGNGPGTSNTGEMTFDRLSDQYMTVLHQSECRIGFVVSAVDAAGEPTGDGNVKVEVNGVEIVELRQRVKQNVNTWIDVGPYLGLGTDIPVRISVSMDVGGSSNVTQTKKWFITTTSAEFTWDYAETTINYINNDFVLDWKVTGQNIEKTINIIIDDYFSLPEMIGTQNDWSYTIDSSNFNTYNLTHGVHTFKMSVTIKVGGQTIPLPVIYKNIIFVDTNNSLPIISCPLHNKNFKQYNTVKIPVIVYSSNNINGTSGNSIYLFEDNNLKGENQNVINGKYYDFNYTPIESGVRVLTLKYENIDLTFSVNVEDLGIDNQEVPNYAFKFQASSFTNNHAVQNWLSGDNIKASFSDNFDWINGGLQSEEDEEKNTRSFVKIKAGTTMTINYPLFKINAKEKGKTIKIIFKTSNCRNYDAFVLSCKKDKKVPKIDMTQEIYLDIEENSTVPYSSSLIVLDDYSLELDEPKEAIFNSADSSSRKKFDKSFILYNESIYQCNFGLIEKENEDDPDEYYTYYYSVFGVNSFEGLYLNAQSATFNSRNNTISTQYCEDSYIELEVDVSQYNALNGKNYIKFWIDGVPSGVIIYDSNDIFTGDSNQYITIGSAECDVDLYMMKVYEKTLSDENHLQNFIADAPNAEEMIRRFNRNNILDDRHEISPTLLAMANPECLVHVYEIPRMTKTKKDLVPGCIYDQYHNSNSVSLHANNVTIKVQGTSSEKYVEAAANLDSDFTEGFIDSETGQNISGWSMDGGNAIPCNFFCTKVNVASCENANNALNQEWYNLFQPYKSVLKCKNAQARDTMQFTNGVLFIKDKNTTFSTEATADKKLNNVFGDTSGYIQNPYPKFYSLANMGNSKDNIHVFHDLDNPLECCIEVKDNQDLQQWMVSDQYDLTDIGEEEKFFEFRYPDGVDEVKKLETGQQLIDGWNNFVSWMAHSNPQPKYKQHNITNDKEFREISYNRKTKKNIPVYILDDARTAYTLIDTFNPDINIYYTMTDHLYGYTNLKLDSPVPYENYTFKGFRAENQINEATGELWQKDYNPLITGCTVKQYNFKNYIETDDNGNYIENYIANENGYTYDTYEYRMAKMLHECEEHLIMDSVIYHYLFIERHCMIDNVAKNTFWSTEDSQHWNLIKDYDNDTANGNDNNGKFTRTYGMEPLDKLNTNIYVFNAHQSVWLNFIHGLREACEWMYGKLEEKTITYKNRNISVWNKDDYLWLFKDWQSRIPERCWIEDYYRKYLRPYELYNNTMFISMMEGGQKTHQRKQYETYQETYISSKYDGIVSKSSYMLMRSNGTNMLGYKLPVTVYSDCYIRMDTGSNTSVQRVKRNVKNNFVCPTNNLGNATMYFYPAKVFSTIGEIDGGQLGDMFPEQVSFTQAGKLRTLVVGTEDRDNNETLKNSFSVLGNPLLEKLYVSNLINYEAGLDLKNCPNLIEVNAINSTFTSVEIADNAPVTKIILDQPTSLYLSNLTNLSELTIVNYNNLTTLNLNNIDFNPSVNSKNIVDACKQLTNYKLTNVNWNIYDSAEINTTKKTINLLERLLTLDTLDIIGDQGTIIGQEPLSASLTGNLLINSTAYNENDSFDIYDQYAQPDIYPNLDISFNGAESKLYTVQILNGDNNVLWKRKITPGKDVDIEFLSDGPNGAFDIANIYKASTLEDDYVFNNNWIVQIDIPEVEDIKINTEIPSYSQVMSNITFIPQFTSTPRMYKVEFFDADGTPLTTYSGATEFVYGTEIQSLYPRRVPYKTDSSLQLYETYGFKGYGLSATSKTVVPDNYKIISDSKFYAVFSEKQENDNGASINVYNNIINPFYLEANSSNKLKVKSGYILSGKITLPKEFNGKPVTGIQSSGFKKQDITHIFWEPNSTQEIEIDEYAFAQVSTLKYYEITDNLTAIKTQAFQEVSFENDMMVIQGEKLTSIGASSFYKSFQSYIGNNPEKYNLKLGGNIVSIGNQAFAYNTRPSQTVTANIQIGSDDTPWVDNISTISLGNDLFAESEAAGSVYNFHIVSSQNSKTWEEINAAKFRPKLGLHESTRVNYQ